MTINPKIIKVAGTFIIIILTSFCKPSLGQTAAQAWFHGKFGILVHYLHDLQNGSGIWNTNKVTSWDQCVKEFNVTRFAEQVNSMKAGYVIFSIQQGDRYFSTPNSTYEKLTGLKRGTATPTRDLVNDLYLALNKYNIKLMLYVTGDGVTKDMDVARKLSNPIIKSINKGGEFVVDEKWVKTWSSILADVSTRYGNKIAGWWVDGVRPGIGYNDNYLQILKTALKKGNKNAIVGFNKTPQAEVSLYSKLDDFTAGEMVNINVLPPHGGKINGTQWHFLTHLGTDWAKPGFKYPKAALSNYVKASIKNGGVVTLDVCVKRDGNVDGEQLQYLKNILK